MHIFTKEQLDFLKNKAPGIGNVDLTELFNNHFRIVLSVTQIRACKKNHHIKSGLTGRFNKGREPFNKGIKGWKAGGDSAKTQFEKGRLPHNYMPVGSERINGDGYVDIKIADPNKWKGKHIVVWESVYGKVPNGSAVIFSDKDNRNFSPRNLIVVTRAELAVLNRFGLISNSADATRSGVFIANVIQKIARLESR
jgi:hypothetical protein